METGLEREYFSHCMLRILYITCDILAAIFAIISPVAIFHWLLKAVDLPLVGPYLEPLSNFFNPLNAMMTGLFHPPPIQYNGQNIPTEQGILACVLTAAFFLMTYLSEYLKTTEQRQDVSYHAELQRQRLKKLKDEQSHTQKKAVTNRRFLVHINYDFAVCPMGGDVLERSYPSQAGNPLERFPNYMTIEFPSLQQGIQYSMEASQSILAYYATLRPVDPQPPFRIGIHAVDAVMPAGEANAEARKLVGFAGANHVVFTQDVRDVLEANGQSLAYHFQSLGMYALEGRQQELFKLFNRQPQKF